MGHKELVGPRCDLQRVTRIRRARIRSVVAALFERRIIFVFGFEDFHRPPLRLMREVSHEPVARQFCDLLQRARFFKEMRRAGNDLQFHFAAHPVACLLV